MREIFISYRRIDTEPSGGHVYADLRRNFGNDSVFMDLREGGIAWGADWDQSLNDALRQCSAMLVLIGPQWATCERTPGVRRLDAPDDWVRAEIANALRRGSVLVLPVLFQGASPPQESTLPAELRELGFHLKQAYPISERNWEAEFQRLVDELVKIRRLEQLHDLATTETGIRYFQEHIRSRADVADLISRSRVAIEATDHEIDEIRLLKGIHDALHTIEAKCLKPLANATSNLPLDLFRLNFVQQDHEIRTLLRELAAIVPDLPTLLEIDLPSHLAAVSESFPPAGAEPSAADRDRIVDELESLIGFIPSRLNDAIDKARLKTNLDKIAELMKEVGDLLRPRGASDAELKPLLDTIAGLDGLRDGLAQQVHEHGLLQSFDNLLREIVDGQRRVGTAGRIEASTLVTNWNRICGRRKAFRPPFSDEVKGGLNLLDSIGLYLKSAVERGDEPTAAALMNDYFNEVGDLFRKVDANLKEFCISLRAITKSLKDNLEISTPQARHA